MAKNTKTYCNKMKKLLQLDRLDINRKGVMRTIAEEDDIVCRIKESFTVHKTIMQFDGYKLRREEEGKQT